MRSCIFALVCLMGVLAVGCSSSMAPQAQTASAPEKAVVTTNGGSTVVFIPSSDPNNPTVLCAPGTEVCPECKAAAVKYFTTGVLDPKCTRTGATRSVIATVQQTHATN